MPTRWATSRSVTPSNPFFENRYSAASRICSRLSARCSALVPRRFGGAADTYQSPVAARSARPRGVDLASAADQLALELSVRVIGTELILVNLSRGGERHRRHRDHLAGQPP